MSHKEFQRQKDLPEFKILVENESSLFDDIQTSKRITPLDNSDKEFLKNPSFSKIDKSNT